MSLNSNLYGSGSRTVIAMALVRYWRTRLQPLFVMESKQTGRFTLVREYIDKYVN